MFKCTDCGHTQKEENKFHCMKCNSFRINWVVTSDFFSTSIDKYNTNGSNMDTRVSVNFKERLYSDLFDIQKVPRFDS